MKGDPKVERDIVSTVDHVIWANRVDTREIDPVSMGTYSRFYGSERRSCSDGFKPMYTAQRPNPSSTASP